MIGQVPCESIVLRLVDGDRPADDPALAQHIGSCLSCFRVTAELRDLPELARAMRADAAAAVAAADPGDAFFGSLAASTTEQWERQRAAGAAPATAAAPAAAAVKTREQPARRRPAEGGRSAWTRVAGWLRAPLPAAFAGAAVAAVIAVVVVESGLLTAHRDVATGEALETVGEAVAGGGAAVAPAGEPVGVVDDYVAPAGLLGDEDPWEALEPRDLRQVVAQLGGEMGGKLPAVDDELVESGPSPTEELESLEADDLDTVARALVKRGI